MTEENIQSADDGMEGVNIPSKNTTTTQQSDGCTLAQYAEAKRLPVVFLQGLGLSDMHYSGRPVVRIPYPNPQNAEAAIRFRIAIAGKDKFRWRKGDKPSLYINPDMTGSDIAVLVEGESDSHTLWHRGICAYGLPGAANWKEDYAEVLNRHEVIYVVIEPDSRFAGQHRKYPSPLKEQRHVKHARKQYQAARDSAGRHAAGNRAERRGSLHEPVRQRCAGNARDAEKQRLGFDGHGGSSENTG